MDDRHGETCPRCRTRALRTADTLAVCASCHQDFESDLRSIPELYQRCEALLAAAPPEAERVSGTGSFGIKLNTAAVDARDTIRTRLRCWSELVKSEHGCAPEGPSIHAMAAFLRAHADWLCRHAAAADAVTEIAETATAARRAITPDRVRRFRVGHCVMDDCEGELVAAVRAGSDLLPGEVRCDAAPEHVWPAYQWRELDRRVSQRHQTGIPWLTPREVAELCQTSMSNVYRLASEKRWRRRTDGRRVLYAKADVLASVA